MNRQTVSSSNINSVGYDESTGILEIEFNNGGIYQYSNVPLSEYESLISASSVGQYFHQNIKERYSFIKVG